MQWNTSFLTVPNPYAARRQVLQSNPELATETCFGAMTVVEANDRWTVEVDVPGVAQEGIDITLTDGILVIEGHRMSHAENSVKQVFNDRTFKKFRRELRVREGVDLSRIEADLKDGVLILTLFRSPESIPQKISIRNVNA